MKRLTYILIALLYIISACNNAEVKYAKIPVEDFFKNPEKSRLQLSPNGEFVSFVKNYKNRANIYCQNLTTGITTQLTFDTTRGISNYVWVNNKQLLYLLDVDGDETFHLFSINNDGKNKVDLTPFDNVQMNFIDIAPQKGNEIYICLNKRNPEIFDLYKLNYNSGALQIVDENPGNIAEWYVDLNGDIRLALSTDGVNEKLLYKKNLTSAYKEVLSINFKENFYPLSFTKDGHSIYALSSINRDKIALVIFDLELAKETKIVYQSIDADINDVAISYETHLPIYASYRSGRLNTHFFNPSLNKLEKIAKKLDDKSNFSIINHTTNDNKFLVKLYSDKNPGSYFTYDVVKDEVKEIGKSTPWLNENDLAETNSFEYRTRDGLRVQAYLTLPNKKQDKYPLLVIAHQHLWQRTNWAYNPEVQFFANRGYAVLRVNHRGVEGFGKSFHEAGFKQIGKKMQDDYTDAVYHLIKKGIVDTSRIGIYGMSFGGYFALNGLVRDSGLYKCAASYSGFTNLFSYLKEFPPYYNQFIQMMYEMIGNPEKDVDYLRECSPAFHTDKLTVPIFIAHGEKDRRMSVEEINQFTKTLKNQHTKVNYMLIPDEGHGFRKEENKIKFYKELELFFEENLMSRK